MRSKLFSIFLTFFLFSTLYLPTTDAQESVQWNLPEGVSTRLGKGNIGEIAYSPDGRRLAVGSSIGIWVYDVRSGEEVALIGGHTGRVYSVAFSPDGGTLASGNWYGRVHLWDAETGALRKTFRHTGGDVRSVAFSPDGGTLASGGTGDTVRLWDVETGIVIQNLQHGGLIESVAFSPDGKWLASGGASGNRNGRIHLWDAETGTLRNTLEHSRRVWSVAFSPDGRMLAGPNYGAVFLWDAETGNRIQTLSPPLLPGDDPSYRPTFLSMAFSPAGGTLATGTNSGTVLLWDTETGSLIQTLAGHTGLVDSLAFSPDGRGLASNGLRAVHFWDAETGSLRNTLTGYAVQVGSVAFSPDGGTLASRSYGGTVHLWDADTGTLLHSPENTDADGDIAFSADGQLLASGSWYRAVLLWDTETGTVIQTLRGHTDSVWSVAFSADGKWLASGSSDDTVRLWDAETGTVIRTFTGHTGAVVSVAFSPAGGTLASGSSDDTVRLWDAETGTVIRTFTGHTGTVVSVAFLGDGKWLASGSRDDTVRLWDAETGTLRNTMEHTGDVVSVAFSADGKWLASADSGDTVHLWDAETGTLRNTLEYTDRIASVAFSPDGGTLAGGSRDGTVLLWELEPAPTSTPVASKVVVSLSPATVPSPNIGDRQTFSLHISGGENVAGYQATLQFDTTALAYVESQNSDYLPAGAFTLPTTVEGDRVTVAAASLAGESSGDGTLATITFEVVAAKASSLILSNVLLTDSAGESSAPQTTDAEMTQPTHLPADVNRDGVVNIIDLTFVASRFGQTGENAADVNGDGVVNISDLVLVAGAFGAGAAGAPGLDASALEGLTAEAVQDLLTQARQMARTDAAYLRGIAVLEQLLALLLPKETALLPNYPNPLNPETWIPYELSKPVAVTLHIYSVNGVSVRTLALGHQSAGKYQSRRRAAYWDGRNNVGEPVASGVYFYTLTAGDFTATRKLLIRK